LIWIWACLRGIETNRSMSLNGRTMIESWFRAWRSKSSLYRSIAMEYFYTGSPSTMIYLNASPSSHPYELLPQLAPGLPDFRLGLGPLYLVHAGRLPTPPLTSVGTTQALRTALTHLQSYRLRRHSTPPRTTHDLLRRIRDPSMRSMRYAGIRQLVSKVQERAGNR
jgi:hypothetical protein